MPSPNANPNSSSTTCRAAAHIQPDSCGPRDRAAPPRSPVVGLAEAVRSP
jgi:hypothetical protein